MMATSARPPVKIHKHAVNSAKTPILSFVLPEKKIGLLTCLAPETCPRTCATRAWPCRLGGRTGCDAQTQCTHTGSACQHTRLRTAQTEASCKQARSVTRFCFVLFNGSAPCVVLRQMFSALNFFFFFFKKKKCTPIFAATGYRQFLWFTVRVSILHDVH